MRNNQIKAIAIILVAVIALSIGFAAFSATLTIESQANVNPNASDFSVKFSKQENVLDESNVIAANIVGDGVEAKEAKIDNSSAPTITDLNVSFTRPGESVTYEFYVMNTGEYKAYLRDVEFKRSVNGVDFISCTKGEGATEELVQEACEGINFELTIGDQSYTEDGTFVVQELAKRASKKVTVKISYETGSALADGPFTVDIGDVALTYASTSIGEYPIPEDTEEVCEVVNVKSFGDSCTYQDLDTTNTITKGDKVTCGTESFYVIEDLGDSQSVKMLSEWNLNISDGIIDDEMGIPYSYTYCESTEGYQDSHVRGFLDYEDDPTLIENMKHVILEFDGETVEGYAGYSIVPFDSSYDDSDYGYWIDKENGYNLNTNIYTPCTGDYCKKSYPAYVYDDNATIKTFVDDYTLLLNTSISSASATGRLISFEELVSLGCSSITNSCEAAPSWVYQTSYWTGSAAFYETLWNVSASGKLYQPPLYASSSDGVRPVIEISKSVIQPS